MPNRYLKLHFTWRHALTAWLSGQFSGAVYTVRHGLIKGMRRKGGLGFLPSLLASSVENTPEARFFASLNLRDAVVYDVGGFEGILTLFFGRQAKEVVTFEPNPSNCERILENLRLNQVTNVRLRKVAVGEHNSRISLVYDPLMPGAGSADPNVSGQIRNHAARHISIEIETVRLDDELERGLPGPDFIKIDVEGMELAVLKGARRILRQCQPDLYLEMHGATDSEKEENVTQIVDFLRKCGYADITHIETARTITGRCGFARRGHLYCRGAVAALPAVPQMAADSRAS